MRVAFSYLPEAGYPEGNSTNYSVAEEQFETVVNKKHKSRRRQMSVEGTLTVVASVVREKSPAPLACTSTPDKQVTPIPAPQNPVEINAAGEGSEIKPDTAAEEV